MGNWHGKPRCSRKRSISTFFQLKEEYKTKQDITLWQYEGSEEPKTVSVKENSKVKVLDFATKWWQIKHENETGFASKYYFRRTKVESYEKQSWYFGAIPKEECEDALNQECNGEGSFLVRFKEKDENEKIFILSAKHYDEETHVSQIKHFSEILNNVDKKCLPDLISQLKEKADSQIGIKLENACMIPAPHTDPGFAHARKDQDTWFIPRSELCYDPENPDKKLGHGHFGTVYEGTFRTNISVAIKILSLKNGMNKDKLANDFMKEKKVMTRLNHPNLVQLYATSIDEEGHNILIQERMHVSLVEYLPKILPMANKENFEETSFKFVLRWCVQVARGMAQLERLNIVHRDLASRNVLLDANKRAKVADFGLALTEMQSCGECDTVPTKWTAPEALFDQKFSSASDVWSFSILMFEIFTLGEKPYKNVGLHEFKEKMKTEYENKKNDFRCKKPWQLAKASEKEKDDIYNVMQKCWDIEPENRPKFFNLEADLDNFVLTGDLIGYDDSTPFRKMRTFSTRVKSARICYLTN